MPRTTRTRPAVLRRMRFSTVQSWDCEPGNVDKEGIEVRAGQNCPESLQFHTRHLIPWTAL
jgi:hypothetical protein